MSRISRAALGCAFFALAATQAGAATVSGTVTDARTGARLPSMVVAAYDTAGVLAANGNTQLNGTYELALPAGEYRILAYDPNGIFATSFDANAESFESSPLSTVTTTLQKNFALLTGGRVSGSAVSAGAVPASGVTVAAYNLSGTRRAFTTVNPAGEYSIVLPPGDYKLVAYDEQGTLATTFYTQARTFSGATVVNVRESMTTSGVSFFMSASSALMGRAADALTNLPIAGLTVYAFTPGGEQVASTSTAANGTFTLHVPAGDYRLAAGDPARVYAPFFYAGSSSFEASTILNVAAGEQRREIALSLVRAGAIAGHVSAGANITVSAYNLDGTLHTSTGTDANGDYTLVVAPGDYKVVASDPAQTFASQFFRQTNDFRSSTSVSAIAGATSRGVDFTLVRAGHVSGVVRSDPSGAPLAGITVAAYSDVTAEIIASSRTGSNGGYVLTLPPGRYRVIAFDEELRYATGYAGSVSSFDAITPVEIASDAGVILDFALRNGVKVSGTIVDSSGAPVSGTEIFAIGPGGERVASGRAVDGDFALVVVPGTYRFVAVDPRRRYSDVYFPGVSSLEDAVAITISNGQSPRLTFTMTGSSRRRAVRH